MSEIRNANDLSKILIDVDKKQKQLDSLRQEDLGENWLAQARQVSSKNADNLEEAFKAYELHQKFIKYQESKELLEKEIFELKEKLAPVLQAIDGRMLVYAKGNPGDIDSYNYTAHASQGEVIVKKNYLTLTFFNNYYCRHADFDKSRRSLDLRIT